MNDTTGTGQRYHGPDTIGTMASSTAPSPAPDDGATAAVSTRIVRAAARLLAEGGREAVSTRAVAAAAGTKPPAIYRLFGDKDGLLDAVAEHGFATYYADKAARRPEGDPVERLRAGWDRHVRFGLDNPALFALMYGDPRPAHTSPAAVAALGMMRATVHDVAAAGRLAVSEDLAGGILHSVATGTVLTLLDRPEDERDTGLSATNREMVIGRITTDEHAPGPAGPVAAATTLHAHLDALTTLSDGERHVLREWLERVAR